MQTRKMLMLDILSLYVLASSYEYEQNIAINGKGRYCNVNLSQKKFIAYF
jgi:hypothetical protein